MQKAEKRRAKALLNEGIFKNYLIYFGVSPFSPTFATVMGTLYLVPTPVGNLEDMTFRAIRILREADMVLCEDTRTSSVLLKHFEVQNRLVAHHKFNEHGTAAGLVERLKAGAVIALVSDAGTPGISDPGFLFGPRGHSRWRYGSDPSGSHGLCSGLGVEWTALRPLLL